MWKMGLCLIIEMLLNEYDVRIKENELEKSYLMFKQYGNDSSSLLL